MQKEVNEAVWESHKVRGGMFAAAVAFCVMWLLDSIPEGIYFPQSYLGPLFHYPYLGIVLSLLAGGVYFVAGCLSYFIVLNCFDERCLFPGTIPENLLNYDPDQPESSTQQLSPDERAEIARCLLGPKRTYGSDEE